MKKEDLIEFKVLTHEEDFHVEGGGGGGKPSPNTYRKKTNTFKKFWKWIKSLFI